MTESYEAGGSLAEILREVFGDEPSLDEDGWRAVHLGFAGAVRARERRDGIHAEVIVWFEPHALPPLSGEQFKVVCQALQRLREIWRAAAAVIAGSAARDLNSVFRSLAVGPDPETQISKIREWLDRDGGVSAACPGVVKTYLWMGPDEEVVQVETHWVDARPVSSVMPAPAGADGRGGILTHTCLVPLRAEDVAAAIEVHATHLEFLGEPLMAETSVPGDDPARRLGTAGDPYHGIITMPIVPIEGVGDTIRWDGAPTAVRRQHCDKLRECSVRLAALWPYGEPE